ncbi:unnamed protein product [Litomosoides sigmodontis]|uniref:Edg1 TPR repeats region domain-containing protein n=1 Tax=Litomosoides sigmodontis TaxID=42156 RepID=A0A3P6V9K7_LITSI|nr:unnamed protein product [Litomosoides sigmodontis]
MTTDLQKAIDELEHFSAILKNASGLYASASELVKYCLPHCTLKKLIETLWCAELQPSRRQQIRESIHDIMQRVLKSTASAIMTYADEKSLNVDLVTKKSWELYDKCSGEKLADVLSNCLFLFHVIYDIRSIPYLFSLDEVAEFDKIYHAAKHLLDQTGLDGLKSKLSKAVLKMYGQRIPSNEETNSVFAQKIFLFSTSETMNNQGIDDEECSEKFKENLEKLISKASLHDFDILEMRILVEFDLAGKIDFPIFKKVCSALPKVEALAERRIADEFLKILKYTACSCKDWNAVMTYFFGAFREVNGSQKTFKRLYQNFEEDMRNFLNLIEDHAQLHTDEVRLEKSVDECAWLLMMSPVDTLISLFLQCLENILIVPNLVRILRKLPAYCDIEFEAVFEEDKRTKRKTSVLMFALRVILTIERSSMQCVAKRRNFVYLCAALCRERRALLKDEKNEAENEGNGSAEASLVLPGSVVDFALIDGSVILNCIVLPTLKQVFYQEIALEIGKKLLTSVAARHIPIIWKAEQGIKLDGSEVAVKNSSGVSIRQLISILLDIINENNFYDCALTGSCEDCLRLLEDRVVIETDTFNSFLTCFDKSLWAYRYAVASWFYKCLISYKREIPTLLYEAFKDESKQTLKAVDTGTDDTDISGRSLMRKLFELAAIHPELALDILKDGFSTSLNIAGHDISGALVDVIRSHKTFPNNKMDGLVEVIRAISNHIDLSREVVPLLTEVSESSFYGLRLIEPLLLIQEAAICAIYYDKRSVEDLNAVPFNVLEIENQVAVKLLKLFCELAKDHMQKEMIDLRRSYLKHKVEIKEAKPIISSVNINREIRVEIQLFQLYFAAVMLTNHIMGLPHYLKILLVQLTNFYIEVGRMKLGPTFDEIMSEALLDGDVKDNMVNNNEPSEKGLASAEINGCVPLQTFGVSNAKYEKSGMIGITSVSIASIKDSLNDRLSEMSKQNAIFMAGTRMIKDQKMSTIIEHRFRNNKRNSTRKSAIGSKPRRGALPPLSVESDNVHGIMNEEHHFDDRDVASRRRNSNNDGDCVSNSGFRRKNKKHK